MMRKFFLLLQTVKYLKAKQIIYQVWYNIKPKKTLSHYKKIGVSFSPLQFSINYFSAKQYKGNLTFEFLNREYQFQTNIDWNLQQNGKLWNYNLQYFYFLQQEDISNAQKQYWLKDIAGWLYARKLPLEPYPVSLRAINIMRYLSFYQSREEFIVESLYAQLNYLYHNFEFHLLGNHLLENAFALLMGAEVFNKKRWKSKAKKILLEELKEQILDDGGHFEQSVMYHQIITFRILELADWYKKTKNADVVFLKFIEATAIKMLDWLKTISFKNGDMPLLNDSANGITFTSNELFSFAGILKLPEQKFISLKDSGYRKYCNDDYECIIDAGGIAASYQPGHSHADALSFVLQHKNIPVITDVGVSTYEADEARNYERSTAVHNTVTINHANQSEMWGSFRIGKRAKVKIINETASSLEAFHNGYTQYNAIHKRAFSFNESSIKIVDVIESEKKLPAKSLLHFHPDCFVKQEKNIVTVNDIIFSFEGIENIQLDSYKFASGFNKRIDGKVVIIEFYHSLKTIINFNK